VAGQAFGSHLLAGPGKFRYDDHSLAIYEQAGVTPADADRSAATVLIFVIGGAHEAAAEVSLHRRLSRGGRDPEQTIHTFVTNAQQIAAEIPHLRARLTTTAATHHAAEPDNTFTFGPQTILDGFETRLASAH
jgi:hypothetical protein